MKLLRYGPVGKELPGILDAQGRIRALFPAISDITPSLLSPEGLRVLSAIDTEKLPLVDGSPRIGPPVTGIRQFWAVGLNYRGHIEESGMPTPVEPMLFNKALTSICGPNDDTLMPRGSKALDYEAELAVVIGTEANNVSIEEALNFVAGYCACNDVSERDWQVKRGGQFVKGKSGPTFGPLGPYLVTTDELPDPQTVPVQLWINDALRQNANTSDMLFSVREIVSNISSVMTLLPGDVIVTGTPAGVAIGMKPPVYLQAGDVVRLDLGPLGTQRQVIKSSD